MIIKFILLFIYFKLVYYKIFLISIKFIYKSLRNSFKEVKIAKSNPKEYEIIHRRI